MGKLIKKKIKTEAKPVKGDTNVSNSMSGKILKSKALKTKRKVITNPLSEPEEETPVLNSKSNFKEDSISSNEDINSTNTFSIEKGFVQSGIQAVFKLIKAYKSKKNNKLFDDELPVFMQVSCIKVPKCPVRTMHLNLKNSLYKNTSEICLITANLRNTSHKEHDKTIEHYENLLQSKGVENIKTIMPLHQLKTEYDQYELRRKLISQYDVFLVEGKICKNAGHLLGKIFKDKRRLPIPVKLHVPKLKKHIKNVLNKTAMNIHPYGDNFLVQVAHSEMSEEEIYENIIFIFEELARNFPGGTENVRAVHLKGPSTMSIPIYYSLKKSCDVPVPFIKSRRPKNFKSVAGTLSTLLNASVLLDPTGKIQVSRKATGFGNEDADAYVNVKEEKHDEDNENIAGKYGTFGNEDADACVNVKEEKHDEDNENIAGKYGRFGNEDADACVNVKEEKHDEDNENIAGRYVRLIKENDLPRKKNKTKLTKQQSRKVIKKKGK